MNFDSIDYELLNYITKLPTTNYYDNLVNIHNFRKKLDKFNNFFSRYNNVSYYNCKIKKYQNGFIKVKKYDFFRYKGNLLNNKKHKKSSIVFVNDNRKVKKYGQKALSSIKRSRGSLFDYVENNKNLFNCFVTLTFNSRVVEDDINQNIVESNKLFHNFVTMYKKKYGNFSYIVVPEYQKRGAVHYHLLASVKNESIYEKVISKKGEKVQSIDCWNYGISKVIPLDNIDGVSKYIAKYMVKENDQRLYGYRFFNRSRDVVKPAEFLELFTDEQLYEMGCDIACPDFRFIFEVDGVVFLSNSFTCYEVPPSP